MLKGPTPEQMRESRNEVKQVLLQLLQDPDFRFGCVCVCVCVCVLCVCVLCVWVLCVFRRERVCERGVWPVCL
jgi:hypothetical protein